MSTVIIDYGVGNVGSLVSSLKRIGITNNEYKVISAPCSLNEYSRFIVPGVGAFDYCMDALRTSGLLEILQEQIEVHKKLVLGICAGAQIMGLTSEEGTSKGLGWIEMNIRKFPENLKSPIPHIGWNTVKPDLQHPLFSGVDLQKRFYFSHSYYFEPLEKSRTLATTQYEIDFASIVASENAYAIQFHPEKSHFQGLQIIKNFIHL